MEWSTSGASDANVSSSKNEDYRDVTMKSHKNWHSITSSQASMDESLQPNKRIRLDGQDLEYIDTSQDIHRSLDLADHDMQDMSQVYLSSLSNHLPRWESSDSEWCGTTPSSSLPFEETNSLAAKSHNEIGLLNTLDRSLCRDSGSHRNFTEEREFSDCTSISDQNRSLALTQSSVLDPSPNSEPSNELCYGGLLEVNTQILIKPETTVVECKGDFIHFDVVAQSKYYVLRAGNETVASLNERVSDALVEMKKHSVRAEAFISKENWIEKIGKWKKSSRAKISDQIPASLNIYGPRELADTVGDILSDAGLYLQQPLYDCIPSGIEYRNPQWLQFSQEDLADDFQNIDTNPAPEGPSPIESGYEAMFDPEFQQRFLEEAAIDPRVKTDLFSHQRQAVDFIRKKETGTLDDSLNLWQLRQLETGLQYYQHVLTGAKKAKAPDEPRGGILADDVGLGKSLTMLASVVASLEHAKSFSSVYTGGVSTAESEFLHSEKPRVSATLIVGPSALILDGWEKEVSSHISKGALKLHKYHGSGKQIDIKRVRDYDIVLTTYATIESDLRRNVRFFQSVCWYRVILDEAHVIRTKSTKQFQAAFELTSQTRWCLTGTPIQNRLQDFGSLVSFLRVQALENQDTFRRLIIDPTDNNGGTVRDFSNLKKLLSSMCLRRKRHLLTIPEPEIHDIPLELSARERHVYDTVKNSWDSHLSASRKAENKREFKKSFLRKYQSLRMICNHGVHESSKAMMFVGLSTTSDESQADEHDVPPNSCSFCFIDISTLIANGSATGLHPSCSQKICMQCLPSFAETNQGAQKQAKEMLCVVCNGHVEVLPSQSSVPIRTALPSLDTLLAHIPAKMAAVVNSIENNIAKNKSLVFSAWKRSLDILGILLKQRGIQTYCIHGELPVSERRRILKDFEENRGARVLLMTFGTGGVGLNLLSVNQIHILEPQWNPAVESQAIGRAVRLNQPKSVTIFRYIIGNSIESDHVRFLQGHKRELAQGFETQPA